MRHMLLMVLVCVSLLVFCAGCKTLSPESVAELQNLKEQAEELYGKADQVMAKILDGSLSISEATRLAQFYREQAEVAEDRIDKIIADAQAQGMTWWETVFALIVAALGGGGGAIGWVRAVRGQSHKGCKIVAPK